MVGNVAFLMKDVVLLAASVYLLRHDALRVWRLYEMPDKAFANALEN
jgi:hypothetical protein